MTGKLLSRLQKLESRISPPDDLAAFLQEGIDRRYRQWCFRRDGRWDKLEADLLEQLADHVRSAQASLEWLENHPKASKDKRRLMAVSFSLLAQQLAMVKACRSQQVMIATVQQPKPEQWPSLILEALELL
ncbi:hypothetical protein GCM10023116_39030 [Kistimonas scapharcae]|uniref:Uncharacterized protein n=1 Tax=Kistimonas scapharcae TaxID=1036133 RepID=A0ABP8V7U0_9GAMM